MIHADPILSNFSFLPDGSIIVHDFGCVKSVPPNIVDDYRALCRAALDGRCSEVPALLATMGVTTASGEPLSAALIAPALDLVLKMLDDARPYRFGYDDQLLRQIIDTNLAQFGEAKGVLRACRLTLDV